MFLTSRKFVGHIFDQAHSEKSAIGELLWGCGGGARSRQRLLGVWGQSPQRSKSLYFFAKNNLILDLF